MKRIMIGLASLSVIGMLTSCNINEILDKASKAAEETGAPVDATEVTANPALMGKITDQDGNAVEGALVRAWDLTKYLPEIATDKDIFRVRKDDPLKSIIDVANLEASTKYDSKDATTDADGKYEIKTSLGGGVFIVVVTAECYNKVVLGLKEDRTLPTSLDEAKNTSIYLAGKNRTEDITLNYICERVTPEPPAPEPEAPATTTPPADATVTPEVVDPNTGTVKTAPTQQEIDDNKWQKFVVFDSDTEVDASTANQTASLADFSGGIAEVKGTAPKAHYGKEIVLIVDIVNKNGDVSRSVIPTKCSDTGEFATKAKLIKGMKTMLSMGYPAYKGKTDPTNQSYIVTIDDTASTPSDFTVTLTWDKGGENDGDFDLDVHVVAVDQDNTEIAWYNMEEDWGMLDIDNMKGFGPEVVTIDQSGGTSGNITVSVEAYSINEPTEATVRVTTPNYDKQFTQTINATGDKWEVGTFNLTTAP